MLNAKVASPVTRKRIALEGHRFTPEECLAHGLVDVLASGSNTADVLEAAVALGEKWGANAKTGVWGLIKASDDPVRILDVFDAE